MSLGFSEIQDILKNQRGMGPIFDISFLLLKWKPGSDTRGKTDASYILLASISIKGGFFFPFLSHSEEIWRPIFPSCYPTVGAQGCIQQRAAQIRYFHTSAHLLPMLISVCLAPCSLSFPNYKPPYRRNTSLSGLILLTETFYISRKAWSRHEEINSMWKSFLESIRIMKLKQYFIYFPITLILTRLLQTGTKTPKQCMESLLGCSKKQASLLTEFLMQ